jgi:hypothetical protein
MTKPVGLFAVTFAAIVMHACGGASATPTAPSAAAAAAAGTPNAGAGALPAVYSRFRSAVQVGISGSTVTLQSQDVPDHVSPYWGQGNALYEAPHAGMQPNGFRIQAMTMTLRVPAAPAVAGMSDTPLGPIGMAVNGVALFNQYAAMRQPLTFEVLSFDRMNGHPAPSNQYHYHFEPLAITGGNRTALVGVLLDGFPVYGPDDAAGTPRDLDSCNGHTSATPDSAGAVYHYHTTSQVPYIAGCFRGTPGAVG